MKTKSIMELRGALAGTDRGMDRHDLAESLRAMARHAVPHYSPAGDGPRVAIVMAPWRLEHLIAAADALSATEVVETWTQADERAGPDTEGQEGL